MSWWRADGDDLIVAVRLTPKSARNALGGVWTDAKGMQWLGAQVTAVPEKGKANAALMAMLAKRLNMPLRAISLEAGDTNRLKRIRISGADSALIGAIQSGMESQ